MKSHDCHKRSSFSISAQDGATTSHSSSHDHYTQALRLNFVSSLLMITRSTLTLTSFIVFNKKHIKHILIAPSKTKLRLHEYHISSKKKENLVYAIRIKDTRVTNTPFFSGIIWKLYDLSPHINKRILLF